MEEHTLIYENLGIAALRVLADRQGVLMTEAQLRAEWIDMPKTQRRAALHEAQRLVLEKSKS